MEAAKDMSASGVNLPEELKHPHVVDFPLRGEWSAPNTPVKRIPSHGTDQFGQRYAFDFMKIEGEGGKARFFDGYAAKYFLWGIPLKECYGYGEGIYAPFDGTVVKAADGFPERQRVQVVSDLYAAYTNSRRFLKGGTDAQSIAGNYVILGNGEVYALLAHMRNGSVCVKEGQRVKAGEMIGRLGHSGNSTAPHLHFQLMDGPDPMTAKGLPCAFTTYEVLENGAWNTVNGGIPSHQAKFRLL
jgi:murein DD-endopeptidase MepM/ murein hydrolase activator NlpD